MHLGYWVATSQKRNPSKISPASWLTLGKYFIEFLENGVVEWVEDLNEYHNNTVDLKELCVSISVLFRLLQSEEALKKTSVLKFATTGCAHSIQKINSRLKLEVVLCLCS